MGLRQEKKRIIFPLHWPSKTTKLVKPAKHRFTVFLLALTECDDLPHEDAEAPHVRLGREDAEVERLGRHPPDGQRALQHEEDISTLQVSEEEEAPFRHPLDSSLGIQRLYLDS